MSSGPRSPRRRRSSVDEDEGGSLPMVPLFAGVIIAGLGIGALLSAFAARHTPPPVASRSPLVVVHTPTPMASVAQATAVSTIAATATPVATKRAATARPVTRTSAPKSASTARPPAATIAASAAPAPSTAAPTPTQARVAQAATPAAVDRQSAYAESLVRRFLEAVAHGDDAAAYNTLGGTSTSLDEARYLDPSMRITSVSTSRAASGGTNVQVEMRTVRGQYFGTFTVDPNGTRITQHEVIPVGGTTAR